MSLTLTAAEVAALKARGVLTADGELTYSAGGAAEPARLRIEVCCGDDGRGNRVWWGRVLQMPAVRVDARDSRAACLADLSAAIDAELASRADNKG